MAFFIRQFKKICKLIQLPGLLSLSRAYELLPLLGKFLLLEIYIVNM